MSTSKRRRWTTAALSATAALTLTGCLAGDGEDAGNLAVLASPAPEARPAGRARQAAVAAVTPGTRAAPTIARPATQSGIPLNQTALIGVISLQSGRKALLRLADGTVRSVQVGDTLDGWKVSAIGDEELRLSKGGKDRTLVLVSR